MRSVLVDTSVWVDHFRRTNQSLVMLMASDLVMTHPLIVGELACGTPPDRVRTLADLDSLLHVRQASIHEVMEFIERERLYGLGCGLVDLLLLTSTMLTSEASLWTMDKRLGDLARRFNIFYRPVAH